MIAGHCNLRMCNSEHIRNKYNIFLSIIISIPDLRASAGYSILHILDANYVD